MTAAPRKTYVPHAPTLQRFVELRDKSIEQANQIMAIARAATKQAINCVELARELDQVITEGWPIKSHDYRKAQVRNLDSTRHRLRPKPTRNA